MAKRLANDWVYPPEGPAPAKRFPRALAPPREAAYAWAMPLAALLLLARTAVAQPLPGDAEAAQVYSTMLSGMRSQRVELMHRHVRITLVASDGRLMDAMETVLRPVQSAAETTKMRSDYDDRKSNTPGRTSKEPRGSSLSAGGDYYVFVGRENLTTNGWDPFGSRPRRVLVHELGHAVHRVAMTDEEKKELAAIARVNFADGDPRDRKAAEADGGSELFAVGTEIWFDCHQSAPFAAGTSPSDMPADLPIFVFLRKIYGPSRKIF